MKLEIMHTPTKPDSWRITITVADKEDFPTVRIFQDHYDYPAGPHFVLFPANCNFVTNVLSTERAAEHWSAMQVSALATALSEWRHYPTKEIQFRYI